MGGFLTLAGGRLAVIGPAPPGIMPGRGPHVAIKPAASRHHYLHSTRISTGTEIQCREPDLVTTVQS
jgi:hypothetical protein